CIIIPFPSLNRKMHILFFLISLNFYIPKDCWMLCLPFFNIHYVLPIKNLYLDKCSCTGLIQDTCTTFKHIKPTYLIRHVASIYRIGENNTLRKELLLHKLMSLIKTTHSKTLYLLTKIPEPLQDSIRNILLQSLLIGFLFPNTKHGTDH